MTMDGAQEPTSTQKTSAENDANGEKVSEKPVPEVAVEPRVEPRAEPRVEPREEYDPDRKKRRRVRGLGDAVFCRPLEVVVRDDRVEQAIRQLKNRMAREGVLRELKNRRHYFKPSELKRIKSREAARRRRKQARQKGNH